MKLLKFGYRVAMKSRYYKYWSKLYRFLFQRKYKNIELKKYFKLEDINNIFFNIKWKKDGFKELWDAIGSPQNFQNTINLINSGKKQSEDALDCDDFAQYASMVYTPKGEFDKISKGEEGTYEEVYLLGIAYKKFLTKKLSGHMVCLVRKIEFIPNYSEQKAIPPWRSAHISYTHLSNWGMRNGFKTVAEVVENIIGANTFVGYSIIDPKTLNLLDCRTELQKSNEPQRY